MNYVSVRSSTLQAVGYDGLLQTLAVRFRNGSEYEYFGVPSTVYRALMAASSQGRYFSSHIRDVYRYRRTR